MKLFFQIALAVVCGGFAILTGIAGASQLCKNVRREASLAMLAGAALLVAAVACNLFSVTFDWLLAVAGSVLIFCSAFYNGKKGGGFHLQHHVIRLALCLVFVVGFALL